MVEIEGYSEGELNALMALGLIDKDLVEQEAKPVEDNPETEREAARTEDGTIMPHITVAKNRGNYIDVDIDDMQYFQGMGSTPEEGYIRFIYGECHKPQNEGMIIRGNYKTISYLNKWDAKINLFGDHNFEITDPHQPGKPDFIKEFEEAGADVKPVGQKLRESGVKLSPYETNNSKPEWQKKIEEQKANGTYEPKPRTTPHMSLTAARMDPRNDNKRFYRTLSGNWIEDVDVDALLDSF